MIQNQELVNHFTVFFLNSHLCHYLCTHISHTVCVPTSLATEACFYLNLSLRKRLSSLWDRHLFLVISLSLPIATAWGCHLQLLVFKKPNLFVFSLPSIGVYTQLNSLVSLQILNCKHRVNKDN